MLFKMLSIKKKTFHYIERFIMIPAFKINYLFRLSQYYSGIKSHIMNRISNFLCIGSLTDSLVHYQAKQLLGLLFKYKKLTQPLEIGIK